MKYLASATYELKSASSIYRQTAHQPEGSDGELRIDLSTRAIWRAVHSRKIDADQEAKLQTAPDVRIIMWPRATLQRSGRDSRKSYHRCIEVVKISFGMLMIVDVSPALVSQNRCQNLLIAPADGIAIRVGIRRAC